MKKILVMAMGFLSVASFAQETVSPEKIANLLGSSKVAPCLAKLYELESEAELIANAYGFAVKPNTDKKEIQTTIEYLVLKGGDMVAGEAKIIVTERLFKVWGPSEGSVKPQVVSCEFTKRLSF